MAFPRSLLGAVPLALVVPAPVQTAQPSRASFAVSVTVVAPCRIDAESTRESPGCAPTLQRVEPAAISSKVETAASRQTGEPDGAAKPTKGRWRTVLIRY
jgi:hypothetical protein